LLILTESLQPPLSPIDIDIPTAVDAAPAAVLVGIAAILIVAEGVTIVVIAISIFIFQHSLQNVRNSEAGFSEPNGLEYAISKVY
jgi:hypothetical protein